MKNECERIEIVCADGDVKEIDVTLLAECENLIGIVVGVGAKHMDAFKELKDVAVFFEGNAKEWKSLGLDAKNVFFYSAEKPIFSAQCWYFDGGKIKKWADS